MARRQKIHNIVKFKNPPEQEMRCVVHDRVWIYHDILLVDGLDSGCTVGKVKARVNELRGIPGSNMEVVIFFVGSDRCSTTDDVSSAGGSSTGGSRVTEMKGAPKEDGPISVCLWKPMKSGRDKRYLVTVAASPA
eukprot:g12781.t1